MKFITSNRLYTYGLTRIIFFYLFFVLGYSISFAQLNEEMPRSGVRSDFPLFNPITYEAISYWSDDTSSIKLIILYRLNPTFLFFVKANNTQQEIYEAKGELGVEIIDDKEVSVSRDFRQIHIERNSLPSEGTPPSDELEGVFVFTVRKGTYQIVIEAKDYASGKSFTNRDTKIAAQAFSSSGLNVSNAIFVEPITYDSSKTGQNKFSPLNNGGNVIIGQRGGCMFQVASFDTSADIHLSWEILNRNENEEADSQKFQGSLCIQESGTPMITEKMGRVTFTILKDTKHDRVVFVPIPLERLEAGRYKFTITMIQDTLKSIKEFSFNVIWPRKPRSLFNLKLAIDALKHIATEEEIDQITTLNSVKSQKAFHEFWRKQNPDTSSAYNPRMAEYYRRVDETIKRYSNKDEMDGYRTDRGRIYILFGSPSITNRLLKPNTAPAEIWTYEKLRQQFTFIDRQRNGNFILEKEEKY